jgi:hypothetical protein
MQTIARPVSGYNHLNLLESYGTTSKDVNNEGARKQNLLGFLKTSNSTCLIL